MKRGSLLIVGLAVGVCLGAPVPGHARVYTEVYFVDAQTGFVAGGDRLLRSTDGGETWSVLIGADTPERVENVWFSSLSEFFPWLVSR